MKKILIISSIINFVHALFNITNNIGNMIFSVFLIFAGIIYVIAFHDEKFAEEQKKFILTTAVLNLFINFIPGLLALISLGKIKNSEKKVKLKEKIDPETRRIGLMLKLGVGMVVLAGFLFATTSWKEISDYFKFIFLILTSGIFAGLYYIIDNKLKIKTSAFIYFILANLFLVFGFLSIGYFALLGPWFSISGAGFKIFYSSLCAFIALIVSFLNYKYPKYKLNTFVPHILFLSLGLIMSHFKILIELILLIYAVFATFLNLIKTNKNVYQVGNILIYILSLLNIIFLNQFSSKVYPLLLGAVLIFNLFKFLFSKVDLLNEFLIAVLMIVLPAVSIYNLEADIELVYVILSGVYSVIYILSLSALSDLKKNNYLNYISVLCNLSVFLLFGFSLFNEFRVPAILLSFFLILSNLVYKAIIKDTKIKLYEHNLLPYKMSLLIYSAFRLLENKLDLAFVSILSTTAILIIYFIFRKKENKNHYFYSFLAMLFMTAFTTVFKNDVLLISLLVLSFASFFIAEKDHKHLSKTLFIYLLWAIFSVIDQFSFLDLSPAYSALTILAVYSIVGVLIKDAALKNIVKFASLVPFKCFTYNIQIDYEIRSILNALYYLYLVYVLSNNIIKKENKKNLVANIGVSFIVLTLIFTDSWLIGLFIGLIGFISITIGHLTKSYKSLFVTGIVITIANILYQFRNLLTKLPSWFYLLTVGLILIGFVTYKEINKKD